MTNLPFNWFDIAVILTLLFGFWRGRKHGMSNELLPLLQAITTVVAGGLLYEKLGRRLYDATNGVTTSLTLCYVAVYVAIWLVTFFIFARIKRLLGEKLVGGDVFGSMEYYLGMPAGVIRYAAYVIVFLALFNARRYDVKYENDLQKRQQEDLGSNFLPTPGTVQKQVMFESMTGKFGREYLNVVLIKPAVEPEKKQARETPAKESERRVNEVLGR